VFLIFQSFTGYGLHRPSVSFLLNTALLRKENVQALSLQLEEYLSTK